MSVHTFDVLCCMCEEGSRLGRWRRRRTRFRWGKGKGEEQEWEEDGD